MTSQLIEIGGKLIDALRTAPLLLGLILLQLLTMGAILYSSVHRQTAISTQIAALTDIIKVCVGRGLPP